MKSKHSLSMVLSVIIYAYIPREQSKSNDKKVENKDFVVACGCCYNKSDPTTFKWTSDLWQSWNLK